MPLWFVISFFGTILIVIVAGFIVIWYMKKDIIEYIRNRNPLTKDPLH